MSGRDLTTPRGGASSLSLHRPTPSPTGHGPEQKTYPCKLEEDRYEALSLQPSPIRLSKFIIGPRGLPDSFVKVHQYILNKATARVALCGMLPRPIHSSFPVEPVRASLAIGTRPGGWVGRGPTFMGGMFRVTGASTARIISSP